MRVQLADLRRTLRADGIAGFTVAMVGTPQCMAYAAVAGVAPIYGLYTGIIPTILGSIFGSSTFLITGPSNATALVTANVLQSLATRQSFLELVFALAVLGGLIKLALGLLRLGWLIRYVSNAVLIGFLTGASILIILGQMNNLLGVPRALSGDASSLLLSLLSNLSQTNPYVLITGLATMALLLLIKRADKRLPAELLALAAVSAAVALAGWRARGVRVVGALGMGELQGASPGLHIPQLGAGEWSLLLTSAVAVAIFSLVEAMSIAKAVALSSGERLDPSREFVGQGIASLCGGFFQCIPSSGSPSRTAVNYSSGATSRLAGVFAGGITLLVLFFFGWLLAYIPLAGLAGVVIVTAFNLVDRHQLELAVRSDNASRIVVGVTLAATLFLPLHYAIYLGAVLSIAIYVLQSNKLQLSYLSRSPAGGFSEYSLDDLLRNPPSIAIVNVEGTLDLGAAEDLEQRVEDITRSGVRVVILRLRRVRLVSSTGIGALERLVKYANRAGTRVLVSGVRETMGEALHDSGVESVIGKDSIFRASDVLFESTQQALERAEAIVMSERTHGD